MKRIKELSDYDLETSKEHRVLGKERNMPKPTEENMRKMVDRINQLTEMVNVLAEKRELIEPESKENTWG